MGSPMFSTIAQLCMKMSKKQYLLNRIDCIHYYKRYVADLVFIIPNNKTNVVLRKIFITKFNSVLK